MNLLDFIFKPARRIETELTVSRMEALRQAASRAQPPDKVIGGTIVGSPSGWTLEIPQSTGGSSAVASPFEVLNVSEEKITIQPGTINGLLALPLNEIDHTQTDDLRYLVIDINMDADSGPTSVTYNVDNDAPDAIEWSKESIPSSIKILIAVIEGSTVYQINTGNKLITRDAVHQVPKASVSVGEYPNDIYYTWKVS